MKVNKYYFRARHVGHDLNTFTLETGPQNILLKHVVVGWGGIGDQSQRIVIVSGIHLVSHALILRIDS